MEMITTHAWLVMALGECEGVIGIWTGVLRGYLWVFYKKQYSEQQEKECI